MKLYEIDKAIEACVDLETGEIIDQQKLDELTMEKSKKVEQIALWVKDLKAEAEALKAEKDTFAQREKVAKNKAASLTEYLSHVLAGEKFKTAKVAISYRKSEAVEVQEGASVPDEFLVPQPAKIDKTGLKKAIKGGAVIDGVTIIEKQNIQIK